uniref:Uncharacterized protein n=1 Tax=Aegilops tauschii subsp. strangulata TaxID=200361 RepID=A0A452ZJU1_AEGTS
HQISCVSPSCASLDQLSIQPLLRTKLASFNIHQLVLYGHVASGRINQAWFRTYVFGR